MTTNITATQVRNEFADIINRAVYNNEEFIVEKQGKPVVKITGYQIKTKKKKTQKFAPPMYDMGGSKTMYTREDMYE